MDSRGRLARDREVLRKSAFGILEAGRFGCRLRRLAGFKCSFQTHSETYHVKTIHNWNFGEHIRHCERSTGTSLRPKPLRQGDVELQCSMLWRSGLNGARRSWWRHRPTGSSSKRRHVSSVLRRAVAFGTDLPGRELLTISVAVTHIAEDRSSATKRRAVSRSPLSNLHLVVRIRSDQEGLSSASIL